MSVKTINTLSKMLDNAAKSVIDGSSDFLSPEEIAEKAVKTIELSLFKLDDIIEEYSVTAAKKVIKRIGLPIQYNPQMQFPTMAEFESKGINYNGGIILYKNAKKVHLNYHIQSVLDNQEKVNASAARSNRLDLNLVAKLDENPSISNAGDAMQILLDEENLFSDTAE